jgi:hypothetical protein
MTKGSLRLNLMKLAARTGALAFCVACISPGSALAADNPFVAANDITWTTLGQNEDDSMPIGNGDLAANAWTEQNGDLVLLVAKSDAWTELGKLVKLGRVRIQLTPNPFVGASGFSQVLRLEDGSIEIRSGDNVLRVWVDANHRKDQAGGGADVQRVGKTRGHLGKVKYLFPAVLEKKTSARARTRRTTAIESLRIVAGPSFAFESGRSSGSLRPGGSLHCNCSGG